MHKNFNDIYLKIFRKFKTSHLKLALYLVVGLGVIVPHLIIRYAYPNPDAWYYMSNALNLAQGKGYIGFDGQPETTRGPIVPSIIAIFFRIFDEYTPQTAILALQIINTIGLLILILILEHHFQRYLGFLSIGLILYLPYLHEYFFQRVMTDGLQSILVLIIVLLIPIAVKESNFKYWILSGFLLGIAFLVKESSIIWTVYPIFFLLFTKYKLSKKNIKAFLAFFLVFVLIVLPWFVYVFKVTGDIYQAKRIIALLNWLKLVVFSHNLEVFALFSIFLTLFLYFWRTRKFTKIFYKSQILWENGRRLLGVCLLVIFLLITYSPTRIDQINNYLIEKLNPVFPWVFALFIWFLFSAETYFNKTSFHLALWLVSVLSIPTFFLITRWNAQPRNLLVFFMASCIVCGYIILKMLYWMINKINFSNKSLSYILIVPFFIVGILIIGIYKGFIISHAKLGLNPGWIPAITATKWLEENVDPGTTILSSWMNDNEIYFWTQGKYRMVPLIPEDAQEWSKVNLSAPGELFTNVIHHPNEKPSNILLLDPDPERSGNLVVIYPSSLHKLVQEKNVQYVLATYYHQRSPKGFTGYLNCSPEYHLVFQEEDRLGRGVSIYKVNNTNDMLYDCPTFLTPETLNYIIDQAKSHPEFVSEKQVLDLIGTEITLDQYSVQSTIDTYFYMGDVYASVSSDFDALLVFRKAAHISPSHVIEHLINSIDKNPGISVYKLALAEIFVGKGEIDEAIRLIAQVRNEFEDTALLHYVYGELLFEQGSVTRAIKEFSTAGKREPYEHRYFLRLSEALARNGEYERALAMLDNLEQSFPNIVDIQNVKNRVQAGYLAELGKRKEAVILYNSNIVQMFKYIDGHPYSQIINFVDQFQTKDETQQKNRTVFFIDQAKETLFMHPPSSQGFNFQVPPNAQLRFSIALSPEVWNPAFGDGVRFLVTIYNSHRRLVLFDKYIDPKNKPEDRKWFDTSIDLSEFSGDKVVLTFYTRPGKEGNTLYDWAGWGNPRIEVPVHSNLIREFNQATIYGVTPDLVRLDRMKINYEEREILFQHPHSRVTYSLELPEQPKLMIGLGMDMTIWEKSDGVMYSIYVCPDNEPYRMYQVFQRFLDPLNNLADRQWVDEQVDLSQFAGQSVEMIFETTAGPEGNQDYDWAGWSNLVLINVP